MEPWEALVRAYPSSTTQGHLRKAVKSAGLVLKEDLAPFEIEWVLQSLISEPVNLLSNLAQQVNNNAWSSVIGASFELLSAIFESHAAYIGAYAEDVVAVCLLNYTAVNRRRALNTLYTACSKNVWSKQWTAIINTARLSLEGDDAVVVKAAKARLIGAICEHHPDTLTEGQEIQLWRTFLSVLEGSRITDSLINAILQGICGLFKNFGMNLPVAEIGGILYENLSKKYILITSCQEICFRILSDYCHLFPEKLSSNTELRKYLWLLLSNGSKAADTLVAVYSVAATVGNVQDIVTNEIYPRIYSKNPQERCISSRILSAILKKYTNQMSEISREFEKQACNVCTKLEFSLNCKVETLAENSAYDHDLMNLLEEASWCIETGVQGSENLLRCVLLLHDAIPSNRKKKLLVHVLLNADPALRTAAITFLISESVQKATYFPIWQQMFDSTLDSEPLLERARPRVVGAVVGYLNKVLNAAVDEGTSEKSTQKLSDLLKFTSQLLSMENFSCHLPNGFTAAILDLVMDVARVQGPSEGLILAVAAIIRVIRGCDGELDFGVVEFICNINTQSVEAIRCARCAAVIELPADCFKSNKPVLLDALQVILTRSDVDNDTLTKAVLKLEEVITMKTENFIDLHAIDNLVKSVEKLKTSRDFSGKSGRILERHVVLFLGKYGNRNSNVTFDKKQVSVREQMFINIPNLSDGRNSMKMNLSTIYDLALKHENPELLNACLSIISAYLSNKPDPLLQRALTAVIVKLSYCHSRMEGGRLDSLLAAVTLCDKEGCVAVLFETITKEPSPGPRKILSNLMSHLLTLDPHDEGTENAIRMVFEKTMVLIRNGSPTEKKSSLDLVESLIECIKQNNELFKELIPDMFTSVLVTKEIETLKILTENLIEKILIFDQTKLKAITKDIYEFLNQNDNITVEILKVTLQVLKSIFGVLDLTEKNLLDAIKSGPNTKFLMILTAAKEIFGFNIETQRNLINSMVSGSWKMDVYDLKDTEDYRSILIFVQNYAEVMLELKYQETLLFLGETIKSMSAKQIKFLYADLKQAIETIKQTNRQTPQILTKHIENWIAEAPVEDLTRNLKMEYITSKEEIQINALLKMLRFSNKERLKAIPSDCFKDWISILVKFYSNEAAILKSKMAAMTDVLSVTLLFLNSTEVKDLCLNSLCFVRLYIGQFSFYLMDVFEHLDSKVVFLLFNDILSYYSREKCSENEVNRITGCLIQIWPRLQEDMRFEELHATLVKMTKINDLKIVTECQPVTWWVGEMTASEEDRKMMLLQILPLFLKGGSEEYWRIFDAPLAPLAAPLCRAPPLPLAAAALSALAACAHPALVRLAVLIASHDNLPPPLEASTQQCVTSLSLKQDGAAPGMLLDACGLHELAVCLYDRVLGPLIRYSSQQICQDFFAMVLPQILSTLRRKTRATASAAYSVYLVQCARAFTLAKWCFEKMPLALLDSPQSPLYTNIELKCSKNIAQELCKLCDTLRGEVVCKGDGDMKKYFRYFHTSNFNCYATVLLKKKPPAKFFDNLLKTVVWENLVDCEATYVIYIEGLGRNHLKRHLVSAPDVTSDGASMSMAPTFTRRTLSDNPFMYDLMDDFEETQCESQAILLTDNELNNHPCAATLCALIHHLSTAGERPVSTPDWLKYILKAIEENRGNVQWLLTQAIINCKESLKSYASVLAPVLLEVVAKTPYKHEDKNLLNGLHVNILNTLHYWHTVNPIKNDAAVSNDITSVIQLLLNTFIHHKLRNSVFKALIQTLDFFVQMYREYVKIDWNYIEDVLKDPTNDLPIYEILETITKNKVNIPELIPALVSKLQTAKNRQTNIAKLLGLALDSCQDVAGKMTALSKLNRHFDRLRGSDNQEYVKVLFYVQNGCREVCNEIHFRHITDLAPKMVREQRTKCLRIIADYISKFTEKNEYITAMFETIDICDTILSDDIHSALRIAQSGLTLMPESLKRRVVHLSCSYCDSSDVVTRNAAFGVVLKAAEEFLTETGETAAKRQKTEPSSKILKLLNSEEEHVYRRTVLAYIGFGLTYRQTDVSAAIFDRISKLLEARDMGVRLLESIHICLYLPSTILDSKIKNMDASKCLTACLKLFLNGYICQEGFDRIRLRDEPLTVRSNTSDAGPSKLLTMSKTFQGTFRVGHTRGSTRIKEVSAENEKPSLDVQIPIQELLNIVLNFCQNNKDASTSLFIETIKQFRSDGTNEPIAKQLCGVLSKSISDLTPCVMEACRLCVDECSKEPGFKTVLEEMLKITHRTEGYELTRLLYEDVLLRDDREDAHVLGEWVPEDNFDVEMIPTAAEFSMEDMLLSFDKLSNWGDLTMQKKRRVASCGLPALWTDEQTFRTTLEASTDIPYWLSKMRSAYEHTDTSNCDQYMDLKKLDVWPRNHFITSCMTETVQWSTIEEAGDWSKLPADIKPGDCLAEWAARLMARSCVASDMENNDVTGCQRQQRDQQLLWCKEATTRGLWRLVPACSEISIPHLTEDEIRPWLLQQCWMLQSQGLKENNQGMMRKALEKLENIAPNHGPGSKEVLIAEIRLKLQLHRYLNSLTKETISSYIEDINNVVEDNLISEIDTKNITNVLEICVDYWNDAWGQRNDVSNQNDIIPLMCSLMRQFYRLNIKSEMVLCTLIPNLYKYLGKIPNNLARSILETVSPYATNLDDATEYYFTSIKNKFNEEIVGEYPHILSRVQNESKMRTCLQLVCDPNYALQQYCEKLFHALNNNDENVWKATFLNMKSLIYENQYAGASYHLLAKYKSDLYEIDEFKRTDEFKSKSKALLKKTLQELQKIPPKSSLNMSDVCLSLSQPMSEGDGDSVSRILGLPAGVYVVRFDKQVQIFTNSLRRPCVVRALLSSGHTRRFIIKRGEPLRVDAATARVVKTLNCYSTYGHKEFKVIPLSEDCGVIEFLEDHVTLRSLIAKEYNLDDIGGGRRAVDADRVVSRATCLAQYRGACGRIPAYVLRSAIEKTSGSVQDYIAKKRNFQDSLAAMAVYHWILGLGDRHLENLMISSLDGAVCSVDFAAVLSFSGSALPELPPARLTRLLTSVCDKEVLESRMQSVLTSLRASYKLVRPVVRFYFGWVLGVEPGAFEKKMSYIRDLLQGTALSHQITKKVLEDANVKNKENYFALLDEIFQEFPTKKVYEVDEQVSSLLLQCTDTRILSITRDGWEPWL